MPFVFKRVYLLQLRQQPVNLTALYSTRNTAVWDANHDEDNVASERSTNQAIHVLSKQQR